MTDPTSFKQLTGGNPGRKVRTQVGATTASKAYQGVAVTDAFSVLSR